MIDIEKVEKSKVYDLLVCSFIDVLRICAPEIPLDNKEMDFYLEILIKWLMLEDHIKSTKQSEQNSYYYVLHQVAKLSALCLLFNTRLIEQVPIIIEKFFDFLGKKYFNQQQYQDFLDCISSTVNEYSDVPIVLVNILLSNLCQNKHDNIKKQAYNIAFITIQQNKSILGNKLRDIILPPTSSSQKSKKEKEKKGRKKSEDKNKSKSNKEENDFELYKNCCFNKSNYLKIIKELSKINPDFLLKLLSEINNNELNLSKKYFSFTAYDILGKALSNENSYQILETWKSLCNKYFSSLKEDKLDFDDKFHIFKCAIKFLTRNDKDKLKENNVNKIIKDDISSFLNSLTSKGDIEKCLKILTKSLNWKIISFCLISLLNSKKNKTKKFLKDYFFTLIKGQILPNFIFQDFKDKKTINILNTLSKPFNILLSSLDEEIKLYQLSLKEDLNENEDLIYIIQSMNNIFNNESKSKTVILMIFFYLSMLTRETSTIWYSLLHMIFKENVDNEKKNQYLNIIDLSNEDKSKEYYGEIREIMNFFNQYIIFVDENSNPDSVKILNSILFTLELFLCSLHYNKDNLSDNNKELLFDIIHQIIEPCFSNKIMNKYSFDVICKILLLLLHICINLENEDRSNIKLKKKLNEILFENMSEYIFRNDNIKPKYYVKLIITYYKMVDNLIINDNNFQIFPKNFKEFLNNDKKINCLSFINELTFYEIDSKFSSFYFDSNFAGEIINNLKKINENEIDDIKNSFFNVLENNENENDNNENEKNELEVLTKKLIPKIYFFSEILKL